MKYFFKNLKIKQIIKRVLKFILPVKLRVVLRDIQAHFRNTYLNMRALYWRHQAVNLIATLEPLEKKEIAQYVISLTSYGERLTSVAPYAIVTLLNQSIKPDKIILWVASEDKKNIPQILEKLIVKGLEIHFCEDIKSYKKLIPTIKYFPDSYIITVDDDIFYPHDWFERLMVEHKRNPQKIICHRAHGIKVDENHEPIPYLRWDRCIEPKNYFSQMFFYGEQEKVHRLESIFPTGSGGVLYPPGCFYKDLINKELFVKLAPYADDIWFWAMAVINREYFGEKSPYIVIENGYSQNLFSVDPNQEIGGNALWNYNWSNNENDKQLKAVINQYPQIRDVLEKIESL